MKNTKYKEKIMKSKTKIAKNDVTDSINLRIKKMFQAVEKAAEESNNNDEIILANHLALIGIKIHSDIIFSEKDPAEIWEEGINDILKKLVNYSHKPSTILMVPSLRGDWLINSESEYLM